MSVAIPQSSPASISTAPAPAPAPALDPATVAALLSGASLRALVQAATNPSLMRLLVSNGATIDVAASQALPAGTPVEVTAQGTAERPQIVVRPLAPSISGQSTTTQPATPAANTPEATAINKAATLVRQAATQQNGLSQLYANLDAAFARPGMVMPASVRAAANTLMALRLTPDAEQTVDAPALKAALVSAGLGRPTVSSPPAANTTAGAPITPAAPASGAQPIQLALNALRDALKGWIDLGDTDASPAKADTPPRMPASPASAPQAPLPPHRWAPTVPQAAALPQLDESLAPRDMAFHLLRDTESALSRHTLLQIASLPEEPGILAARHDNNGPRLTLDIPLVMPEGTAVAQVRINRDDNHRDQEQQPMPVWRAEFSIDIEPIGPVHVKIALVGERTAVTLHAERGHSADHLAENLILLEASLRDAALEPGEMRCRGGARPPSVAPPGLFVDQAS